MAMGVVQMTTIAAMDGRTRALSQSGGASAVTSLTATGATSAEQAHLVNPA